MEKDLMGKPMGNQVGNQSAFFPISLPTPRRGVGNGKTEVGKFPSAAGLLGSGKWERRGCRRRTASNLAPARAFAEAS